MQNLVKMALLSLCIVFSLRVQAQQINVKAGLNLPTMSMKIDGNNVEGDFSANPGFHVGGTVDFPINDLISLETGLLLSSRGTKTTLEAGGVSSEGNVRLLYLDLPINAKATFDLGNMQAFATFGPYLGAGLSGNIATKTTVLGTTIEDESAVSWGSDENTDNYKRLDFGVSVGAGVMIKGIQVGAFYGLGLANISPSSSNNVTVNNRLLGISFGYQFAL